MVTSSGAVKTTFESRLGCLLCFDGQEVVFCPTFDSVSAEVNQHRRLVDERYNESSELAKDFASRSILQFRDVEALLLEQ